MTGLDYLTSEIKVKSQQIAELLDRQNQLRQLLKDQKDEFDRVVETLTPKQKEKLELVADDG